MTLSACWRSPIRSFISSIPTDILIILSLMPRFLLIFGFKELCVITAGAYTRLSTLPRETANLNKLNFPRKRSVAAKSPSI